MSMQTHEAGMVITLEANALSSRVSGIGCVRWVWRYAVTEPNQACGGAEKVLQQQFEITDYRGSECIGMRTEWRDVPVESEGA